MEIRVKFDAALWCICALCAVIATSALLVAYPALWPWLGDNSSNIASWVQAIGSIGAIVGTWWATKTQIQTAAEAARIADELRKIEMTENAFHICTRVHRLARNTKQGLLREGGVRTIDIGRLESRWLSLQVTTDALLTKDLPGEVLRLLMDSRGFSSIAANACKEWRESKSVLNFSIESDLLSIGRSASIARWKLRKQSRDMKAALHARKLS